MKKYLVILLSAVIAHSFWACQTDCTQTVYYMKEVPIYMAVSDLVKDIKVEGPRQEGTITSITENNTGYYLVDDDLGIHVLTKTSGIPVLSAFISMPRCMRAEAIEDFLIVVQVSEIHLFDVSDHQNIRLVQTVSGRLNTPFMKQDSVVIDYDFVETVDVIENANCGDNFVSIGGPEIFQTANLPPHADMDSKSNAVYICDNLNLVTLEVSPGGTMSVTRVNPFISFVSNFNSFIHADDDELFIRNLNIGSAGFDIANNPSVPVPNFNTLFFNFSCTDFVFNDNIGCHSHFFEKEMLTCDPNNRVDMFPKLSNTSSRNQNAMFLVEPTQVELLNSLLFVCDGPGGFICFDVSDQLGFNQNAAELDRLSEFDASVFCLSPNRALISGDDGIFYVDVSTRTDLKTIGKVE